MGLSEKKVLFEVEDVFGKRIRTTKSYWKELTSKHPFLLSKTKVVKSTLRSPDIVKLSKYDISVFLYYKHLYKSYHMCAVARHLNGTGYIITAYKARSLIEGKVIWEK